jgi:hypothetical protein
VEVVAEGAEIAEIAEMDEAIEPEAGASASIAAAAAAAAAAASTVCPAVSGSGSSARLPNAVPAAATRQGSKYLRKGQRGRVWVGVRVRARVSEGSGSRSG